MLPNLPLKLMDKEIIKKIGNQSGDIVGFEANILSYSNHEILV